MKNLNNILFYNHYPTLDLHGYDRETGRIAILDFIKDNIKMKQDVIVIVHGVGSGIIMKMTNEVLKKNKDVVEYKSSIYNRGCTLVLLKNDKN